MAQTITITKKQLNTIVGSIGASIGVCVFLAYIPQNRVLFGWYMVGQKNLNATGF